MLLLGGLMFLLMEFSGCVPITENTKNINSITALPGENVSLPCQVSNMNFTVLNWSRSDLLPQYVFMYKDKKPLSENQHPSFAGRVELEDKHMKDGNISVTLKNVTTNDSGTYTCEVIWNRTKLREIISRVNLQVQPGESRSGWSDPNPVVTSVLFWSTADPSPASLHRSKSWKRQGGRKQQESLHTHSRSCTLCIFYLPDRIQTSPE
ncbi:V-set and immunoglobulin domain-containing protein 1-like isoform X1 [Echeneis naucrates]|uniref:V-set and immunoglobulin domain-containing protein 1-like isoform X1 n=1 Tax=Echeneis naucrates TaxID=173247 RepID=UPI001113D3A8|nr:V-set and immunoglobulin domain-containing protein 1-like isoform X1 [Echeneis naucrates]